MAEKQLRAARPELWIANKTFFISGNLKVTQGDTIVDGHPILRKHKAFFRPFAPTFTLPEPEAEEPAKPTEPAQADPAKPSEPTP